jgi:hypothetical protein
MGGIGGSQEQSSTPKLITDLLTNLLAFYIGGNQLPQFHKRGFNMPILGQGEAGAPMGAPQAPSNLFTGGSPFNINPQALLPSGTAGAGNIPGTILPNYPALMALAGRPGLFGSLNQANLAQTFGLNQPPTGVA